MPSSASLVACASGPQRDWHAVSNSDSRSYVIGVPVAAELLMKNTSDRKLLANIGRNYDKKESIMSAYWPEMVQDLVPRSTKSKPLR